MARGCWPGRWAISTGLEQTFWPGRLRRLKTGPLADRAKALTGEEIEIWLDGGHNPHGARVLARAMGDLEESRPAPLILISGLQANKDAHGFFAPFADLAAAVFTVRSTQEAAADAETVAAAARAVGLPALATDTVETAIAKALASSPEGMPRILICGSLYLAGDILASNG